jgi:polyferredoxin
MGQQLLEVVRPAQTRPQTRRDRRITPTQHAGLGLRSAAFVLTFALLAIVQVAVERPMLMAERFVPGAGWIEAIALAAYASWLVGMLLDPRNTALWRRRLWTFFSIVFFGQLALGFVGVDEFLMSGKLHLPIPGMIVGGPLYRGSGFFMPILFAVTVLLAGPAWCSYLCYVGSWDLNAAYHLKRPTPFPRWRHWVRGGILVGIVAVALGLKYARVAGGTATLVGLGFGLVGVAVMVGLSRRRGTMVHCVTYCPIGLVANVMGKLSPFRMRIAKDCTECAACALKCRYGALERKHIETRKTGLSCTLCGDCVSACKGRFINYSFVGLSSQSARTVFLVLAVSLHAVFLGVARI